MAFSHSVFAQFIQAMSLQHRVRSRAVLLAVGVLGWADATVPEGTASPVSHDTIRVYGPGGPLPAMKEAAAAFQQITGNIVLVTGGPTSQWIDQAGKNADVVYSGAEHMMSEFLKALPAIDETTVRPLYLRPAALLVRPGNPRKIGGFSDVLRPGIQIMVVNGSGQTGLWEDVAGRKGDLETLRAFRSNIKHFAANSGEARTAWLKQSNLDVWLIWTHWQVANRELADLVPIEEPYLIYRPADVSLTGQGKSRAAARQFVEFLQSREGARIFAKWGWTTQRP